MPQSKLISAVEREQIAQLQLLALGVVEGVTAGRHRSLRRGASVEFKEHRQYVKGDEIRSIDWKLFGKTDRLYIRQYEDETNLRAWLLVDQSGSMKYAGRRAGLSKHTYAMRLAACLATLLLSQQDAAGLALLNEGIERLLAPRSNPSHLQALFAALVQSKPHGPAQLVSSIEEIAGRGIGKGLVFLISDCFTTPTKLATALSLLRHGGSEIVIFQVLDPDECDFPFRSLTEFRSLEIPQQLRSMDSSKVRQAYLNRLSAFQRELSEASAREKIELVTCRTDQNLVEVLAKFLQSRGRQVNHLANSGGEARNLDANRRITTMQRIWRRVTRSRR
ncbi:MAG: DUF58 domain-containing protein [Planctomycetales bacterium]|nr:DUF58 domain-containing protein [Planctomycetales bacterium]